MKKMRYFLISYTWSYTGVVKKERIIDKLDYSGFGSTTLQKSSFPSYNDICDIINNNRRVSDEEYQEIVVISIFEFKDVHDYNNYGV